MLGMEVSRTNFHSDSECQLRGPASAARSQCPTPSKAQAGLSAAPRAHSPLLFSGLRRQVGQEKAMITGEGRDARFSGRLVLIMTLPEP